MEKRNTSLIRSKIFLKFFNSIKKRCFGGSGEDSSLFLHKTYKSTFLYLHTPPPSPPPGKQQIIKALI